MVFNKISRINGVQRVCCDSFVFDTEETEGQQEGLVAKSDVSWKDIWANKQLRTNLWASCLLYSEASFNFYLLTFYLKYFPGNLFQNSAYFAVSDLIAFVVAGVSLQFASIQTNIRIGSALGLAGGFMYLFTHQNISLTPITICLARIGQTVIFNTSIIGINRLFPTLYVATAYGVVNFCGHLYACLSPFVAEIPDPFPFIVFVSMIGVAAAMSFMLTEITDREGKGK